MINLITTYGLPTLISAAIAYLLGSISFAIPVTRMFIGEDIRSMGSGNAGFTNVLRCVGKPAAIITFIGDFAKGIGSVFIGELVFQLMCAEVPNIAETARVGAAVAGLFALLGHLFPLYFGFKGGKGVLISAGIICALDWRSFLVLLILFLMMFALTQTVSKCSLTVAVCYPVVTLLLNLLVYKSDAWLAMTLIAVCFAVVVIYMHRSNIRRILDGTEPKTTVKKSQPDDAAAAAENPLSGEDIAGENPSEAPSAGPSNDDTQE